MLPFALVKNSGHIHDSLSGFIPHTIYHPILLALHSNIQYTKHLISFHYLMLLSLQPVLPSSRTLIITTVQLGPFCLSPFAFSSQQSGILFFSFLNHESNDIAVFFKLLFVFPSHAK